MTGSTGKIGKIPFFAIGDDELAELPRIHAGQRIACPAKCGKRHVVELCKDADGNECTTLQFVTCAKTDKSFLVGIKGRRLR